MRIQVLRKRPLQQRDLAYGQHSPYGVMRRCGLLPLLLECAAVIKEGFSFPNIVFNLKS